MSGTIFTFTTPPVHPTTNHLTLSDHWDHLRARVGINRSGHLVEPGLYSLGNPTPDSPVFVTANYTLSFDAVRSSLDDWMKCYILVLDTKGINVWCAAGKGTFGTGELVNRIHITGLADKVNHRVLILPQLGATGVSAHELKKLTGFRVEYGPVRAADLSAYLETHKATPEMRRVQFNVIDRMVLFPVELVKVLPYLLVISIILYFASGPLAAAGAAAAMLAGIFLFPILLPFIPTKDFSSKGFILGGLVALPFALAAYRYGIEPAPCIHISRAITPMLLMPPVTAFISLNFTGSTTFTSVTGVRKEISTYTRVMAWMFASGTATLIILAILRITGW
ncbi:MAG: mercury methylation corrinoid protein HgcA [ANME-2 cluster archaeon]|nr:mercury methylation corrinoid protein HgcA [ANME-2 cluster archaeon]MDF1531360.1 mercury methylation corrinoid protein HgcA [ANME-2 cluster archaeon]